VARHASESFINPKVSSLPPRGHGLSTYHPPTEPKALLRRAGVQAEGQPLDDEHLAVTGSHGDQGDGTR